MRPIHSISICIAIGVLPFQSIHAKEQEGLQRSEALDSLIACRSIADNAQRLACFDRETAAFAEAESRGDVIVANRSDVEKARVDAFGYSVGDSALLKNKDGNSLNSITSTIASASRSSSGKYRMVLENGSVWQQVDTIRLRYDPAPGLDIEIEKAPFGSFSAKVKGQRIIKVKRVD